MHRLVFAGSVSEVGNLTFISQKGHANLGEVRVRAGAIGAYCVGVKTETILLQFGQNKTHHPTTNRLPLMTMVWEAIEKR